MNWLEEHIAVICMAFGLLSAMFVMFSWGIGYYANALWGTHFDIFSCWQGISAMGTGLVGLLKWLIDSTKNSPLGVYPRRERDQRLFSLPQRKQGGICLNHVSLEQIKQLAINSKEAIWQQAQSAGRDVILYLHWSAGHYGQFFDDYHINIDYDGSIYASTDDLAEIKAHTWRRNTGAIGIALACCYNATTNDFGPEPPTEQQVETMAQVVAALCKILDLTVDAARVMTHAEAADLDDYGPATTCERWDLWFLPGVAKGEGGNTIRNKALLYQQQEALTFVASE